MTPEKLTELNAALNSGDPLTTEQLAWHLQVDPKHAPRIAEAFGLEKQGGLYPWVRIWRAIHKTEGLQLAQHLANLKASYPGSMTLAEVEDLEAELRKPLLDFTAMAEQQGRRPDTLSKALRQGRTSLPFPMIDMGPRTRHFRALEVRLWLTEEIPLNLPQPPRWATTSRPKAARSDANHARAAVKLPLSEEAKSSADPVKKAIFGHFSANCRNGPT